MGKSVEKQPELKLVHWVMAILSVAFIIGSLIIGFSSNNPDRSNWLKSIGMVIYSNGKWREVEHWVDGKM